MFSRGRRPITAENMASKLLKFDFNNVELFRSEEMQLVQVQDLALCEHYVELRQFLESDYFVADDTSRVCS